MCKQLQLLGEVLRKQSRPGMEDCKKLTEKSALHDFLRYSMVLRPWVNLCGPGPLSQGDITGHWENTTHELAIEQDGVNKSHR